MLIYFCMSFTTLHLLWYFTINLCFVHLTLALLGGIGIDRDGQ